MKNQQLTIIPADLISIFGDKVIISNVQEYNRILSLSMPEYTTLILYLTKYVPSPIGTKSSKASLEI